jgi:hypothetical protein
LIYLGLLLLPSPQDLVEALKLARSGGISIITATRVPAMPKVAKPAASIIKKSFCGMAKILAVINIKIAVFVCLQLGF